MCKKLRNCEISAIFDWDEEEGCTNEWIERLETKLKHWVKIYAQTIVDQNLNNPDNRYLQEHDKAELKELRAEISAITNCFRTFSAGLHVNDNLKIEVARLWLSREDNKLCIVTPTGEEYSFRKLPAGYKRLFNIVLDLAYRSYLSAKEKA